MPVMLLWIFSSSTLNVDNRGSGIQVIGQSNISIENIGNLTATTGVAPTNGIDIRNSDNVSLDNIVIGDSTTNVLRGINLYATNNTVIDNSYIHMETASIGIFALSSPGYNLTIQNTETIHAYYSLYAIYGHLTLENLSFVTDGGNDAIDIGDATYGVEDVNAQNITVVCEDCWAGLWIYARKRSGSWIFNDITITGAVASDASDLYIEHWNENISIDVYNSSFTGTGGNNTLFCGRPTAPNSVINFTNVTASLVNFDSNYCAGAQDYAELHRNWYVRANVTYSGTPANGLNVDFNNVSGQEQATATTAATGLTPWVTVLDYVEDSTGIITDYNNYTVNSSNSTHLGSTSVNISSSMTVDVLLSRTCVDNDGDGFGVGDISLCTYNYTDCNDNNPYVFPPADNLTIANETNDITFMSRDI